MSSVTKENMQIRPRSNCSICGKSVLKEYMTGHIERRHRPKPEPKDMNEDAASEMDYIPKDVPKRKKKDRRPIEMPVKRTEIKKLKRKTLQYKEDKLMLRKLLSICTEISIMCYFIDLLY